MEGENSVEQIWLPVIGRALVYLSMHRAGIEGKTIGEKATFLKALGLDLQDIANMLNTTPASARELLRLARNKPKRRGAKKNGTRKSKRG